MAVPVHRTKAEDVMARDEREPQSYGSGADWVTGNTGQKVHDPKSPPTPEHQDFYDSRRDSEESPSPQGGLPSKAQFADAAPDGDAQVAHEETPAPKVTTQQGGAKRDSYFKRRDYE